MRDSRGATPRARLAWAGGPGPSPTRGEGNWGELTRRGPEEGPGVGAALDLTGDGAGRRVDLPEFRAAGGIEPVAVRAEADALDALSVEDPAADLQRPGVDRQDAGIAEGEQRAAVRR